MYIIRTTRCFCQAKSVGFLKIYAKLFSDHWIRNKQFCLHYWREMSIIYGNTSGIHKLTIMQWIAADIFLDRQERFNKLGLLYRQYPGYWTGFPESMFTISLTKEMF